MSFRKAFLLLAAFALVSASSAYAQFGVYGMFTVDRLSNTASSPLEQPSPNTAYIRSNSVDPLGGTGGVYYDFWKVGPVKLGADLRGSILTTRRGAYENFNGQGAKIYSTLGGIRAVFHTPFAPLKPYVQGSVGLGRSNYGLVTVSNLPTCSTLPGVVNPTPCAIPTSGSNPVTGTTPVPAANITLHNNFEYEGIAGLDIKLLPIMDWRVAEFGYGGLDPFGTYSHNYPIKQVSMGFVFHLPF
jgi:hypothetical protein